MGAYEGTDNLEIMQLAENYNAFLAELVGGATAGTEKILDFGAGIGTFAVKMRNAGFHVACVEPDLEQLGRIEQLGFRAYASIDDVQQGSVDFIYSLNVLEHIENDQGALKNLADKLVEGGRVLIYVPAFNMLYSSMDEKVGHYRRYTRSMLKSLAESAGLNVERIEYVDCAGFFVSFIFKYIGNKEGDINASALKIFDRYVFPLSRFFDRIFGRFFGKNVSMIASR